MNQKGRARPNCFDYQPGKVAKHLKVSLTTLKDHLKRSGLYEECFQRYGKLRIPHDVVCTLLNVPPGSLIPFEKRTRKPSKRKYLTMNEVKELRVRQQEIIEGGIV